MTPFETVRFISTIVAVVGLIIIFFDRVKSPTLIEAEHSKSLPGWIGWVGWILATLGTIGFIVLRWMK